MQDKLLPAGMEHITVLLSCTHSKMVVAPIEIDFDAVMASTVCPFGCGYRMIVEALNAR